MSYESGDEQAARWIGFVCPHCPGGKPLCVYGTQREKLQRVIRYRRCERCGYRIRTEELPIPDRRRGDLVR